MRVDTKLKILQFGIPLLLILGLVVVMRVILPAAERSRRLFDLGSGYETLTAGNVVVYFHPGGDSEGSRAFAQQIASDLDEFVEGMVRIWGEPLGLSVPEERISVLLHATNDDYERYWGEDEDKDMASAGKYRASNRSIGVRAIGHPGAIKRILQHECSHMLLDLSGLSGSAYDSLMPSWLNEGLASFFEHGYGGAQDVGRLRFEPSASLESLLRLSPEEFYSKDRGMGYYRLSELLVAFFMQADDGRYREDFLDYVRGDGRRLVSLNELARNHFGIDGEELQRRWRAFAFAEGGPDAPDDGG